MLIGTIPRGVRPHRSNTWILTTIGQQKRVVRLCTKAEPLLYPGTETRYGEIAGRGSVGTGGAGFATGAPFTAGLGPASARGGAFEGTRAGPTAGSGGAGGRAFAFGAGGVALPTIT